MSAPRTTSYGTGNAQAAAQHRVPVPAYPRREPPVRTSSKQTTKKARLK